MKKFSGIILFGLIAILFTTGFFEKVSIIAINSQNHKQQIFNAAPMFYDYHEVFFSPGAGNTFRGALRGKKGKGYLLTNYDLNTGKIIKKIQLPDLKIVMRYDEYTTFFPNSEIFVYHKSYYDLPQQKTAIIQLNITCGARKVLLERNEDWLLSIKYINANTLLIKETSRKIDGETNFIFRNLHTGSERKSTLPYCESCDVHAVSPDGKLLLVSTFYRLFIYNVEMLKVTNVLIDKEHKAISFKGNFSPDSKQIVFSMNRNSKPELYYWEIDTGNPPVMLMNSKRKYDFYSPCFLNDDNIIYHNGKGRLEVFNLSKKSVVENFRSSSIWSPLFVINHYIVFDE